MTFLKQLAIVGLVAVGLLSWNDSAQAFAVFARTYEVPCKTCHSAITRRSEFEDAFRKSGFQWPVGQWVESAVDMKGTAWVDAELPLTPPIGLVSTVSAAHSLDDPSNDTAPVLAGGPSFNLLFAAPVGRHLAPNNCPTSIFSTQNALIAIRCCDLLRP